MAAAAEFTSYALLAVRSTCKTFRLVTNELPFWQGDKFGFEWVQPFEPRIANASFVVTLLKDSHPVQVSLG